MYYTVGEVAEKLKLEERTVTKYIREGKIEAYKIGRGYRIEDTALTKFLESRKIKNV